MAGLPPLPERAGNWPLGGSDKGIQVVLGDAGGTRLMVECPRCGHVMEDELARDLAKMIAEERSAKE